MDITWKLIDLAWRGLAWVDAKIPPTPTLLPFKFTGIINAAGKRERVRLALRNDLNWNTYYHQSKHQKSYWYTLRGLGKTPPSRRGFILQLANMIIEFRLGSKGLDRE